MHKKILEFGGTAVSAAVIDEQDLEVALAHCAAISAGAPPTVIHERPRGDPGRLHR